MHAGAHDTESGARPHSAPAAPPHMGSVFPPHWLTDGFDRRLVRGIGPSWGDADFAHAWQVFAEAQVFLGDDQNVDGELSSVDCSDDEFSDDGEFPVDGSTWRECAVAAVASASAAQETGAHVQAAPAKDCAGHQAKAAGSPHADHEEGCTLKDGFGEDLENKAKGARWYAQQMQSQEESAMKPSACVGDPSQP